MAPILVGGNVLALLLALRGECVLHASAVEIDGSALAFVGGPGGGKSTVAALVCAHGGRLVSDDMLRVEVRDGAAWCFRGSQRIRLRRGAAEVVRPAPPEAARTTADGRAAVRPASTPSPILPIRALTTLQPSPALDRPSVQRLRPRDALLELLRFPRIASWRVPEPHLTHLDVLHRLVSLAPVFRAELPSGAVPGTADVEALVSEMSR